jgi:hypothetical protein
MTLKSGNGKRSRFFDPYQEFNESICFSITIESIHDEHDKTFTREFYPRFRTKLFFSSEILLLRQSMTFTSNISLSNDKTKSRINSSFLI